MVTGAGIDDDLVIFDDVNLNDVNVFTGSSVDSVRVDTNTTPANAVSNLNGNVLINTEADNDFVQFGKLDGMNMPEPDKRVNINGSTHIDGDGGGSQNTFANYHVVQFGSLTFTNITPLI